MVGQERLKPQEDKNEEDWSKVNDLRGSPMSVGNLEEIIDKNHAIVSSLVGPEILCQRPIVRGQGPIGARLCYSDAQQGILILLFGSHSFRKGAMVA